MGGGRGHNVETYVSRNSLFRDFRSYDARFVADIFPSPSPRFSIFTRLRENYPAACKRFPLSSRPLPPFPLSILNDCNREAKFLVSFLVGEAYVARMKME